MMYVIFNPDGSIKSIKVGESIQQGNNGVNEIFVAIDSEENYGTPTAYFELPNGSVSAITGIADTLYTYSGWTFTLTTAQTQYAGKVLMSISFVDLQGHNLFTYQYEFIVNPTGFNPEESYISTAMYNALVQTIDSIDPNKMLEENSLYYVRSLSGFETAASNGTLLTETFPVDSVVYDGQNKKLYKIDTTTPDGIYETATWTKLFDFREPSFVEISLNTNGGENTGFIGYGDGEWSLSDTEGIYEISLNTINRTMSINTDVFSFPSTSGTFALTSQCGTKLYKHTIQGSTNDEVVRTLIFITNDDTPFTFTNVAGPARFEYSGEIINCYCDSTPAILRFANFNATSIVVILTFFSDMNTAYSINSMTGTDTVVAL